MTTTTVTATAAAGDGGARRRDGGGAVLRVAGAVGAALMGAGMGVFGWLVGGAMASGDVGDLSGHADLVLWALFAALGGGVAQAVGWIGFAGRGHGVRWVGGMIGALLVSGVLVTAMVVGTADPVGQTLLGAALVAALAVHAWLGFKGAEAAPIHSTSRGVARFGLGLAGVAFFALMLAFARRWDLGEGLSLALVCAGYGGYALGNLALTGVFAGGAD